MNATRHIGQRLGGTKIDPKTLDLSDSIKAREKEAEADDQDQNSDDDDDD